MLGGEDPLEKGMATHSSIRAWKIPRTGEPGGQSQTRLGTQARRAIPETQWLINTNLLLTDLEVGSPSSR